jgi:polyhydroxyalkanoate synthesis repressor PhaR
MSDARIIKRYANRKLYDTQHSRYVTLDQISEMIRAGDDVKIIDNKSKEDLTSVTLAQIIFEEEKKQRSFLPLQAMRNIIQHGGESFSQLVNEAQKRVTSILPKQKRGEGDPDETFVVEADETYAGAKRAPASLTLPEFREWVQQSQRILDEWQKKIDGRIRNAIQGVTPFAGLQSDVRQLADRIADLEGKLRIIAQEEAAAAAKAEAEAEANGEANGEDTSAEGAALHDVDTDVQAG